MREITWKLNLRSSPKTVFRLITTDQGREKFWVEKSEEREGMIHFEFINGWTYDSRILEMKPDRFFKLLYFDMEVSFLLEENGQEGTDLTLRNIDVPDEEYEDIHAGWLSVLFALKGAVDYDIDLRNHDPQKTWDQGFVEN